MQFKEGDAVPFYLSEEEKIETKWDCESDEVVKKKFTKNDLQKNK